jgi:hypothetical protein
MGRKVGDEDVLSQALEALAIAQVESGNPDAGRGNFEEAVFLQQGVGNQLRKASLLANLAVVELDQHHYDRAEELMLETISMNEALGNTWGLVITAQNLTTLYAQTGRVGEAYERAQGLVAPILALRDPILLMDFADTCVDIYARLGDAGMAARLLGAVEAIRDRNATPRRRVDDDELQMSIATAKLLISKEEWNHRYKVGRNENVEDLLRKIHPTSADA